MNSKHRVTYGSAASILLVALVLAPGLAAAPPAKSETPTAVRWAVRADTPVSADLALVHCQRVRSDVDAYGGTVTGTLTHELAYDGKRISRLSDLLDIRPSSRVR